MARKAKIVRKTTETDIALDIDLDKSAASRIDTTIPFLNHMLELFARHGQFKLVVKSKGDTEIDDHHLVEDLGICLGQAVGQALGKKTGINRYGSASVPMDESLCRVDMDICGRPYLIYKVRYERRKIGGFDPALVKEFFKAFTDHSGITLHITLEYGSNSHHIIESVFKAFARALRQAVTINPEISGVLSTKGTL
ncbi:MAG: imidazoleglycerol-phosphate dehydratase HisB [Smithellaceae bacterium]|jgi:imidazoleglycerol-phosphate dehydratase|nr:imidazoleglycerol-phosphate dehydratase HisB [Smithellaceae bacterium]MDD3258522.1 imidazoleglycerol-phosphate dehydratase HisB [Smithellaceae bacterium]MDD3847913.1 imidazoleglycerol-phosphate dehydratase HisB [Smithellaceae bacterium]HOG12143.1 imidazoleglycerol-phosphate dehydratase HisB [Smithellaceae bacterium]HOQ71997.1 imidazoleglycerol-phosphate dehydratase HisB [Smithellaceae bacterium]